jgi:HPr kinase/phosphorylase
VVEGSIKAAGVKGSKVSVSGFVKEGWGRLSLELVAGAGGLEREIPESAINRPGLALAGFFRYFAHHRIQVLGLAEHVYLASLDAGDRYQRLANVFARRIPCMVVSRGRKVFPEMIKLAETHRVPLLRTKMITMDFVNKATIIMVNLMAPRMKVQGTTVELMGIGVLLEGKPGIGKSETALGLVKRGHALVSDDITSLRVDSAGNLVASPVDVTRYHMEIRGVGIIHVPSLFGVASVRAEKVLDMVATLVDPSAAADEDRGDKPDNAREYMGVKVPRIVVRVSPGRDVVNVIETAALDIKLRRLGHDAAKELDDKLISILSAGRVGSE